jgi:AcrR family transcriptional regulator
MAEPRTAEEPAPDAGNPPRVSRLSSHEILDAAVLMFARKGYRATNLGDVARELGVTRQALYYYFPKKHDILDALFTYVFNEVDKAVNEADQPGQPAGDRFNAMYRAHVRTVMRYPAHLHLVLSEVRSLPESSRQRASARRHKHQQRFVAAFDAAVREGSFAEVPPDFAVSILLGAANSVFRWLNRVGPADPEEMANRMQHFFAIGYVAPAGGASELNRVDRTPRRAAADTEDVTASP